MRPTPRLPQQVVNLQETLERIPWTELASFADRESGGARGLFAEVDISGGVNEAWLSRDILLWSGTATGCDAGKPVELEYEAAFHFHEATQDATVPRGTGPMTVTLKNGVHGTAITLKSDASGKIGWRQLATAKRKLCGQNPDKGADCPCSQTTAGIVDRQDFEFQIELAEGIFRSYMLVGGASC